MKLLMTLILLLSPAASFASNCGEISEELQALRQAQQAIVQSLSNNHETFATSMEEVASDIDDSNKNVPRQVTSSMRKTASAFRARGVKGKSQAQQLDEATAELITRVVSCLNRK